MANEIQHARDISDRDFLQKIYEISAPGSTGATGAVLVWELAAAFDVPEKIILAKARRVIDRGLVDGCACGCRGDFFVTPKGRELLDAEVTS